MNTLKRYLAQYSTWDGFVRVFCGAYLLINLRHISAGDVGLIVGLIFASRGAVSILQDK